MAPDFEIRNHAYAETNQFWQMHLPGLQVCALRRDTSLVGFEYRMVFDEKARGEFI